MTKVNNGRIISGTKQLVCVRTYVHGFLIKLPSRKVTWINCAVQARLNYMSELKIHWPFRWAVTHACGYLNDHFLLALMHADLILFYGVGILSSFIRVSLRLVFSRLVVLLLRAITVRRVAGDVGHRCVWTLSKNALTVSYNSILTRSDAEKYLFTFWRNNRL